MHREAQRTSKRETRDNEDNRANASIEFRASLELLLFCPELSESEIMSSRDTHSQAECVRSASEFGDGAERCSAELVRRHQMGANWNVQRCRDTI